MKLATKLMTKTKSFCRDTTASMIIVAGAAMPVIMVVGGVGLDLMSVQMKENAAAGQFNSIGTFATALNGCTGKSSGALATCAQTLQDQVNSYARNLSSDLSVTVTPGLWCTPSGNGSPSFILNSGSCSGSSVSAVKVSGIQSFNTRFLRLFGTSQINRKMEMILADDKMTGIATSGVCPSIILNEELLKSPSGGDVKWSEKSQSPRDKTKLVLRSGQSSQSFDGELGSVSLSYPFFIADPSGSRTSFPSSERSGSGSTPITSIQKPSGTDFDLTAGTKYRRLSIPFSANSNEFSKTVSDRDYGSRSASDNGGPQILRELKKNWEGKTCMALIGKDNKDGTVTVNGSVPFTFDVVCDGMRKRTNNKWVAYKDDGKTLESKCSYSSDTDKVDISIAGWLGDDRNADSDEYTPSDRNKWKAQNNGKGSQGYVRGTTASTNRVKDDRSYN